MSNTGLPIPLGKPSGSLFTANEEKCRSRFKVADLRPRSSAKIRNFERELSNFRPCPGLTEAAIKGARNKKHRRYDPEHWLVGLPTVPDPPCNHRAEDAAPDIKHTHVAANLREVFATEDIADHSPGHRIGGFDSGEEQYEKPEKPQGAAKDEQQNGNSGGEKNERYQARFIDIVGEPAEQEGGHTTKKCKRAERERRLLLGHSFPDHHRNEVSRYRMIRSVSHRGAKHERPKSERADRLTGGDIDLGYSQWQGVFILGGQSCVIIAVGHESHALRRAAKRSAERNADYQKRQPRESCTPTPAPRMHNEAEHRSNQYTAEAVGGAVDRHGAGTQANKPRVGQRHRRVHETAGVGQRNQASVND